MNRKLAESNNITLNSLIALSNIDIKLKPIDTYIHSVIGLDTLVLPIRLEEPTTDYLGKYLVVGDEIVKINTINNTTQDIINGRQTNTCQINVIRQQFYTQATETLIDKHCRLVTILTYDNQGSNILSYSFTDSATNTNSDLFSVELSNGSLVFTDNFQRWSPLSTIQEYQVHNKKTIVYFFKGQNNDMILKNLGIVEKISFSSGTSSEIKKITLSLKSYLYKWYNQDVSSIQVLKNIQPKEFFKTIFSLKDNEVYYVQGVDPTKIITVNRVALKSFKKVSELLKEYCKHSTIRFTFDKGSSFQNELAKLDNSDNYSFVPIFEDGSALFAIKANGKLMGFACKLFVGVKKLKTTSEVSGSTLEVDILPDAMIYWQKSENVFESDEFSFNEINPIIKLAVSTGVLTNTATTTKVKVTEAFSNANVTGLTDASKWKIEEDGVIGNITNVAYDASAQEYTLTHSALATGKKVRFITSDNGLRVISLDTNYYTGESELKSVV